MQTMELGNLGKLIKQFCHFVSPAENARFLYSIKQYRISKVFGQYLNVYLREHLYADNAVTRTDVNWIWEIRCQQNQQTGQKIWWIKKFSIQTFFLRSIYPCSIKQKICKNFYLFIFTFKRNLKCSRGRKTLVHLLILFNPHV